MTVSSKQLALDLPKFMEPSAKDKAQTLLQIIGLGDQIAGLEHEESAVYNERLAIGRIADQKMKYAKEHAQEYAEAHAVKEKISAF